ncbi:methyl-accepting chemotaxis protein [Pseudothermotoga sp.]|uniref:methyl-accepting chemotaxis protein n=1 Tax=Pseudothermotoga sp. TaxID=2033661 RepID=UPI000E908C4B|nr:methyl-accepting chemotaxis protein [Pseudothermotoga sp.]HBJ80268.1 hypothetical protein [Pseudothermotoga sp.]
MKSIRTRIYILTIPVIVIVLAILAFIVMQESRNILEETIIQGAVDVLGPVTDNLDQWIESKINQLKPMANSSSIKQVGFGGLAAVGYELKDLQESVKDSFDFLFVALKDGKYRTGTKQIGIEEIEKKMSENAQILVDIFEKQLEKSISVMNLEGKDYIIFGYPITDYEGSPVAVMAGAVGLDKLGEIGEKIKVSGKGYGSIVDQNGVTLWHPNSEYILKFNLTKADEEYGFKGFSKLAEEVISSIETGYGWYEDNSGQRKLIVYSPLNSVSWFVTSIVTEKEIMEPSTQLLKSVLIITGIIVAVLIVVLTVIGWIIVKPIKNITKKVEEFKAGELAADLTGDFSQKGKDEIATMGNLLDSVIKDLRNFMNQVADTSQNVEDTGNELAEISNRLARSSEEILKQIDEINSNAQNISASLQETTSGVQEVAASAQNVSKSVQNLVQRAEDVSNAANTGNEGVKKIIEIIDRTTRETSNVAQRIKGLAGVSRNIGEIVETISSIAEQTNLLALNAAIEAARAGEHGRGFAVVADEVRKLAEQSHRSAQEISDQVKNIEITINESIDKSNTVVDSVEKTVAFGEEFNSSLSQLKESISEFKNIVNEVLYAIDSQIRSTQEIESAVNSNATTASEILNFVEETDKAVQQLSTLSRNLSNSSEILTIKSLKLRTLTGTRKWLVKELEDLRDLILSDECQKLDWTSLEPKVRDFLKLKGDIYEAFFIADEKGNFITSTGKKGNISDRKYFNYLKQNKTDWTVSDPIKSRATGNMVLTVAFSIIKNNTFKGVAGANLILKRLEKQIEQEKI